MTYVNSQATVARGVTVSITPSGGVLSLIAEITDDGVPMPQTSVDDIEVTNQDSGDWKEYKAGRKDGGETEIKGNAVDGDVGQAALAAAAASGTTCLFITTFPSGSSQSFYGVVKTFDHVVDGQILKFSAKVKVTGAPTFSTTKSALTALSVTGQSIFPVFAGTTYKYVCNVVAATETAVAVPTCSGATITVNGTTVASAGNGSVTLGAAGTLTEISIVVKETSKAAVVYTIQVARAAS